MYVCRVEVIYFTTGVPIAFLAGMCEGSRVVGSRKGGRGD